jgi:hypothetical protein
MFHFCPLIYFVSLDYRSDMTFEKTDIFQFFAHFFPGQKKTGISPGSWYLMSSLMEKKSEKGRTSLHKPKHPKP